MTRYTIKNNLTSNNDSDNCWSPCVDKNGDWVKYKDLERGLEYWEGKLINIIYNMHGGILNKRKKK